MRRLTIIAASTITLLALVVGGFLIWAYRPTPSFEPFAYDPVPLRDWPTKEWPRSSPEAQGMSSPILLAMADDLRKRETADPEFYLDSMTVIRNGTIVAEIYPNPNYPPDTLHVIHSATKSVVSALVGIAIERGLIESAEAKLVGFFPGREVAHLDDAKADLCLRDLLSMQSGLHSRDSYLYGHEGLLALQRSDDWVQFALDLPMAADPGSRFDYSNVATFLLGAVLERATQSDVMSFAREALFDPLGIEEVRWEWTDGTIPIAWARMWMKPEDLAKIGLLYLQKGQWDGQHIIATEWIEQSLRPHAFPKNVVDVLNADMSRNQELSSRNWVGQRFFRPLNDGYGYQWWLDRDGIYAAIGTNGQFLIVSPEHNLVFVATSKSTGLAQFAPAEFFESHVLRAVQSDAPLPEDVAAFAALTAMSLPPRPPSARRDARPLPDLARNISGATFVMEPNPYNTNNIRFVFDERQPIAEFSYSAREDWSPRFKVGLDGAPRLTENDTGAYVAVGEWKTPNTLTMDVEIVGYTTFDTWEFVFEGDKLVVTESTVTGDYSYSGRRAQP